MGPKVDGSLTTGTHGDPSLVGVITVISHILVGLKASCFMGFRVQG